MNFSEFSFWWILLLFCVPFFTARLVGQSCHLWRGSFDMVGIAALSMLLFFHASATSFLVFVVQILFNYGMVRWMITRPPAQERLIATVLIILDVCVLAYFKYLTFFVEDALGLVMPVSSSWRSQFPLPVLGGIPPGVSFYTFQMVAFVVDSLKARRKKAIEFMDYVNFVAFFPQIVAGPIERRSSLLPQVSQFRFKFTAANWDWGFRWLSLGLFMKFVLADNIAPYIDLQETANAWLVWFYAFLFTLRIYFDFAGYSFIALGIARILGVRLTVNFLAPYTSQSINEFWRRWHVSLSTWFRDYVFLPLMGSRKAWAPAFLFITFTLSGFWHGAAWNFILWGAYHGALLLLLRYAGRPFQKTVSQYIKQPQALSWALTFGSIILGCVFFMEVNTPRLFTKLLTLVTPWAYSWHNLSHALSHLSLNESVALGLTLLLAVGFLLVEHIAVWQERALAYELFLVPWVAKTLLVLTILLAANIPSEFIYFEF